MRLKTLPFMMLAGIFLTVQLARAVTMDELDCRSHGETTQEGDISSSPVSQMDAFRHAFEAAECLRRATAAEGAEWLETESLLLRSLEEADKGQWDAASQLVQKAHFQAKRALQQAEREAQAWKNRVVD